jgi:carnitine monooxygenase subunit
MTFIQLDPARAGGGTPTIHAYLRRMLQHVAAGTTDLADEPFEADASIFRDPALHQRELDVIFRGTPQVVAWSGELARPGSFITRDVAGVPALITRRDDGSVAAFLNACTHRGSTVAEGCGEARRFVCPYHGWTFDTEGQLVGLPAREAFDGLDIASLGLEPLPVVEEHGMIVLGLRRDVNVVGYLDEVAHALADHRGDQYRPVETRTWTVRANWKLVVDVNLELYHVPALHRDTLYPMMHTSAVSDAYERHATFGLLMRGEERWADVPETEWPDRIPGSLAYFLYPSTVILEAPNSAQMLRVLPGATPTETIVHVTGASVGDATTEADRQSRIRGLDILESIFATEDLPAAERCQRGFDGGLTTFRAGRNEPLIAHVHRCWSAAVA